MNYYGNLAWSHTGNGCVRLCFFVYIVYLLFCDSCINCAQLAALQYWFGYACNCEMKDTEVPNPRHRSACDCTCVLTRNRSPSRDSLMLAMRICFCLCKVHSRICDALWQALCNLSSAFLADFTLWFYCSHMFYSLANYTLLFIWIERPDHGVHMSSVLQVTVALHCGHTFVGGILTVLLLMANNRTCKERLSHKMAVSMWSKFTRMHVFCGVKNGQLVT